MKLKTHRRYCECCGKVHDIDLMKRESVGMVHSKTKKTPVYYMEWYYYCPDTQGEFKTDAIHQDNKMRIYDSYATLLKTKRHILCVNSEVL
jgi:hypothetical protein